MKKMMPGNLRFTIRMIRHLKIILLAVLSACSAAAQESRQKDDPALARVQLQLTQYSKAAGRESISPDSALKILAEAIALAKEHKLKNTVVRIWNTMAKRMNQKSDFAGCQRYLDSAFALNDQLKDPELTCILNQTAAGMYKSNSNYAKAASSYFRAVQAVEEHKIENREMVALLYNDLGIFMTYLNEDSFARKNFLIARQHALKMQPVDSALLIDMLVALGYTELETDTFAAKAHFNEAYAIVNKLNAVPLSYTVLENLAMTYVLVNQYDSAQYFLDGAMAAAPPGASLVSVEAIAGVIACRKKKYAAAEKHLLHALQLTHNEADENLDVIYETLSQVYAARGEYQKAYTFHKKYMEQYTLLKGDSKMLVADFMLSLQALEHDKTILKEHAELSSKEAAIKRHRMWIAAMCLVSVMLCIILIMAYRNYRNKKSQLNSQMRTLLQAREIERLRAEAEGADNERSRIAYDIHDGVLVRLANVKMNLTGLHGLAGDGHYQDIVGQLDMATKELRNTAHNLMPEILLEEGLEQAIFYFCKATEQASGLNIKFQIVGAAIPRLQPVVETSIYRIVQGLIQNVIQHAKAGDCLVQLQYTDYLCSITVEDNGQGMDNISGQEGYGFKSIRNRVKMLLGTFDIGSTKGLGTTVYVEFDVRPFILH